MLTRNTERLNSGLDIGSLASRFVAVDALPWLARRFPKSRLRFLAEDKATGTHTTLTRMAPGAILPMHEHVGLEQSLVLQGSLTDDHGTVSAGNFVWPPAGSVHSAHSPDGCLVLGIFAQPNRFVDAQGEDFS